jgi:hypothetical protein
MSEEEMISEIEIYLSHVVQKDFPLPKAIKMMYEQYKRQKQELIEITKVNYIDVDKLAENYNFYKNLAYEYLGNSVSKDKIRAKIEELEKEQKEYKGSQEWEIQDNIDAQINILKELLEEE